MASPSRDYALVYINGERHEIRGEYAFMMLADYLRYEQGLTGTKIVCAEGDCGSCTVLRTAVRPGSKPSPTFEAINSCCVTTAQLDGSHVVTVEGLAESGKMSAVQEAVVQCHGTQCGYCTPGFAMALTAICERRRSEAETTLDSQTIKNGLTGNLCRCTGYTSLIEAGLRLAGREPAALSTRYVTAKSRSEISLTLQRPLHIKQSESMSESKSAVEFFAPLDLTAATQYRRRQPEARLIAAATDLGVQINKDKIVSKQWLSLHLIADLYKISNVAGRVEVGARVSLHELRHFCQNRIPELANFLDIFASPQVKNIATLIGNIANASPIGDTLPFMMVSDGVVHVVGGEKPRDIPMSELYLGYRSLALKDGELISHASFKLPRKSEFLRLYKVSQRKDLDIATVGSAFLFKLKPKSLAAVPAIQSARIAFGGTGPTVLRCSQAENFLAGKNLTDETLFEALHLIQQQITPQSDLRGSATYRRVLVENLFRRYWHELSHMERQDAAT